MFDTGKGGFYWKRDEDFSLVISGGGSIPGGDGVVPEAVEVLPLGADHLRAGVFREWVRGRYLRCPGGLNGD